MILTTIPPTSLGLRCDGTATDSGSSLTTCKSKLCDLVMLERILLSYDGLSPMTPKAVILYGKYVDPLVDDIIIKLKRLLESNTRLTCRNMLLANFKTMKEPDHWLNRRLFTDLPKEESLPLQGKIMQMVDLFQALAMKIINVDPDYAHRFFKRLQSRYRQQRYTEYQIWRAKHPFAPFEAIAAYQAKLIADMLQMGIMSFDDEPNDEEVDDFQLELLKKKLSYKKDLPVSFEAEYAKLLRRSHWAGDLFIIEYEKFLAYLFPNFDKMSKEQHIALYNYDVQMKQVREDLVKLKPELARYLPKEPETKDNEPNRFAPAKHMKVTLQNAKWFKTLRSDQKYNHQWIEHFIDDLFASEWGDELVLEWNSSKKHVAFEAGIVGCLAQAGVITGKSKYAMADVIIPSDKKKAHTYGDYMGRGQKKDYAQWICDYVK